MHVFFATDGSPSELTAERVLATFPFDGPPRLTIATVCPAADLHAISSDVTSPVTEMLDRCRTDAAKLLVDAADRCKAWTPKIDRLLLDGHPAEELLKAINRLYPDVVVVGAPQPRGRQADAPRQCLGAHCQTPPDANARRRPA